MHVKTRLEVFVSVNTWKTSAPGVVAVTEIHDKRDTREVGLSLERNLVSICVFKKGPLCLPAGRKRLGSADSAPAHQSRAHEGHNQPIELTVQSILRTA